jgi:hypothetical protein
MGTKGGGATGAATGGPTVAGDGMTAGANVAAVGLKCATPDDASCAGPTVAPSGLAKIILTASQVARLSSNSPTGQHANDAVIVAVGLVGQDATTDDAMEV